MKKITVSLLALISCGSFALAGSDYSGKDMKQTTQPLQQWYADKEWNVDLFGTYAFTGTDHSGDRYLGVDHAWGGGVDAKYFFSRYFGLGVEGYALSLDNNHGVRFFGGNTVNNDRNGIAGAALGTFTLRYPIPGTRFAPYGFAGGGAIFGGGGRTDVLVDGNGAFIGTRRNDSETEFVGQFGGGFEVRITPHIGWINDFSWNVVNGTQNNFGMVRSGINFAF